MLQAILNQDFRAIARLITLVENELPEATRYLRELYPHTGKSFAIGITGAPGAGKSTLVDWLAGHYRQAGRSVGVIAVDPTSPFTGGAILGDRIRMQSRNLEQGTFIRSMATRGNLGGLARATSDVLLILDAAGFDTVLVETVGVGQDEVDVARTADVTLVLLVPGMGDEVQAMKAGIMEIGDIFVINKSDHPGVERIEAEVHYLISMSNRSDGWTPRVVKTTASEGTGIEECIAAIDAFRSFEKNSAAMRERQLQIQKERLLQLARSQLTLRLSRGEQATQRLQELARQVAERSMDPYSAAEELLQASPADAAPVRRGGSYRKIDHVGIAVHSVEQALKTYRQQLSFLLARIEEVSGQATRVAILPVGESRIELLEAMGPDSPVARFLAKRGEGIHHICFQVEDVAAQLAELKAKGVRLIDSAPREGADGCLVAFVHPQDTHGVLIELSQPAK